jgi:DNA topoisomerase-1
MGRTEAHEGLVPPKVEKKPRKKRKSSPPRSGKLVIVESPAKARTVGRFLGKDYTVKASVGHVRDLLRSQISVDVENDFTPKYRVPNEKRDVVKELKASAAKVKEVYLATDPDREGEAIAWHLVEAVDAEPELVRRVVFHEITDEAIRSAFKNPRAIDMCLVDAQQARRILDRLVGYNLSPLLWAKVRGRLSAGRVQSVALRMIVDREKEIREFDPQEYWTIDADFLQPEKPPEFRARLRRISGEKPVLGSEEDVNLLLEDLKASTYSVSLVKPGERIRRPSAPFTTSTLQQTASRRLRYSARRTMAIAQQLYEGIDLGADDPVGLITYMRTDSTSVSKSAQSEAREYVRSQFGEEYLPENPPEYKTKSARAQEAHEAIRPTSVLRVPEEIESFLSAEQFKLYSLIWKRFLASQMSPAIYDTLAIEVKGKSNTQEYLFRVSAASIRLKGYTQVYDTGKSEKPIDKNDELSAKLTRLPKLNKGDPVDLQDTFPEQHFTQPPKRYSDATLVSALEEHGIGRPSTYAPILSTLQQRGYVERKNRRLFLTEIGEIVNELIVDHFPNIVDLGFTAKMETDLDQIADGSKPWVAVVRDFYDPFAEQLELAREHMPEVKTEPEILDRLCPETGHPLVVRIGRFGKFIGCSNFPECKYTEAWLEKIGVRCPKCEVGDVVERRTRKGRIFYGCSRYPECDFTSWKRPLSMPCPNCEGLLVVDNRKQASCMNCETVYDLEEVEEKAQELA